MIMALRLDDGQGLLFENDKGDNPKRPDFKGEINIAGENISVAAWKKKGAKGKFLSLSVGEKPARSNQESTAEGDDPW